MQLSVVSELLEEQSDVPAVSQSCAESKARITSFGTIFSIRRSVVARLSKALRRSLEDWLTAFGDEVGDANVDSSADLQCLLAAAAFGRGLLPVVYLAFLLSIAAGAFFDDILEREL